ncbi:hypothetical protein KQI84_01270 [bacterium]|nr:hypothetical protein [bacterium]
MAKRRKRSSKTSSRGLFFPVIGVLLLMVLAVAGGYAWRSYAPLPLPGDTPLSGDASMPTGDIALKAEVRAAMRRAEQAEEETDRLRRELNRLSSEQQQTEAELADMQIKDVLGEAEF